MRRVLILVYSELPIKKLMQILCSFMLDYIHVQILCSFILVYIHVPMYRELDNVKRNLISIHITFDHP